MTTAIQTFIAAQTALGAGGVTAAYYDASAGAAIAGENGVVGLQSATLTGFGAMVLPNPAADYRVAIDGNGDYTITDTATNTTVAGGGLANIVFDNGATTTTGSGAAAATSYTQELFVESAADVQIAAFYQAVLGRLPDLPGLQYWEADLAKGDSLVDIAAGFVNSTEFLARFPAAAAPTDKGGANDTAFVTALYNNILDRAPDAAGEAYWINSLATGTEDRAGLLIAFAGSAENLSNITSLNKANPTTSATSADAWLVNENHGGYASANGGLPLQTVITQGFSTGYIDLSLVNSGPDTFSYTDPQGGSVSYTSTAGNVVSASNLTLNNFFVNMVTGNNDSFIFPANQNAVVAAVVEGSNETINLNGAIGTIVEVAPLGNHGFGQSVTISGWTPGKDVLGFYALCGTGSHTYTVSVSTPTAAAPASVGSQNPAGSYINFINVGNVGGGSAAEVAAAANQVYQVSGQGAAHQGWLPEEAVFYGTSTSGNTVFEAWFSGGQTSADSLHTGKVQGYDFHQSAILVGISAGQLTAADFN